MKAVTWIGVDIAKDSCVVAQRCPEGFQTEEFPITPQGLKALGNWLPQQPRLQIVLEATGPYWRAFTSGFNSVAPEIPIAVAVLPIDDETFQHQACSNSSDLRRARSLNPR